MLTFPLDLPVEPIAAAVGTVCMIILLGGLVNALLRAITGDIDE